MRSLVRQWALLPLSASPGQLPHFRKFFFFFGSMVSKDRKLFQRTTLQNNNNKRHTLKGRHTLQHISPFGARRKPGVPSVSPRCPSALVQSVTVARHSGTRVQMPCPSWDTSGWRGSKETREASSIRNGLTITNIYVPLYSEEGIFIYTCDLI